MRPKRNNNHKENCNFIPKEISIHYLIQCLEAYRFEAEEKKGEEFYHYLCKYTKKILDTYYFVFPSTQNMNFRNIDEKSKPIDFILLNFFYIYKKSQFCTNEKTYLSEKLELFIRKNHPEALERNHSTNLYYLLSAFKKYETMLLHCEVNDFINVNEDDYRILNNFFKPILQNIYAILTNINRNDKNYLAWKCKAVHFINSIVHLLKYKMSTEIDKLIENEILPCNDFQLKTFYIENLKGDPKKLDENAKRFALSRFSQDDFIHLKELIEKKNVMPFELNKELINRLKEVEFKSNDWIEMNFSTNEVNCLKEFLKKKRGKDLNEKLLKNDKNFVKNKLKKIFYENNPNNTVQAYLVTANNLDLAPKSLKTFYQFLEFIDKFENDIKLVVDFELTATDLISSLRGSDIRDITALYVFIDKVHFFGEQIINLFRQLEIKNNVDNMRRIFQCFFLNIIKKIDFKKLEEITKIEAIFQNSDLLKTPKNRAHDSQNNHEMSVFQKFTIKSLKNITSLNETINQIKQYLDNEDPSKVLNMIFYSDKHCYRINNFLSFLEDDLLSVLSNYQNLPKELYDGFIIIKEIIDRLKSHCISVVKKGKTLNLESRIDAVYFLLHPAILADLSNDIQNKALIPAVTKLKSLINLCEKQISKIKVLSTSERFQLINELKESKKIIFDGRFLLNRFFYYLKAYPKSKLEFFGFNSYVRENFNIMHDENKNLSKKVCELENEVEKLKCILERTRDEKHQQKTPTTPNNMHFLSYFFKKTSGFQKKKQNDEEGQRKNSNHFKLF